jgi:hypothetical protein
MRVFKTRWFVRFANDANIGDDRLAHAIARHQAQGQHRHSLSNAQ